MRIGGNAKEVLNLAEGDSVRLNCPYILDPEDSGSDALGIEWMQVNPEPSRREKVVGAGHRIPLTLHFMASTCWAASTLRGKAGQIRKPRP